MLFLAGCKKDDVITPESRIEQLRNQVSDWYNISTKEVLTGPDASTKRIASNSLNTLTSTDYSVLPIESLNFNKSYINFDSLSLTGLTVPMRINKNTGEYIQLTTVSNNKKTKGYFVRSIPDDNWYKKLGVKSDFSRMSGKIFVYNIKGKLISKAILVDGLVVNNLSQNQTNSNSNTKDKIRSSVWGYSVLDEVFVNSYIRHSSWYDLIGLAIFDSGNDVGFPLGSNYVPFYPFDQNYGAPGGGGGTAYQPPTNPLDAIYNCNCNCPEEDEEISHYSENFEPKWGQLGTLSTIVLEMNKILVVVPNYYSLSFQAKLENHKNYFNANRMFKRDYQNNFIEDLSNGSKKVDRYLYTFNLGWIDMHHFFYAAYLSEKYLPGLAFSATMDAEAIQILKNSESAFSYEDIPSNVAGIHFFKQYGNNIKNGSLSLESAVNNFFQLNGATSPRNAPNYDYIPHVIDGFYATNFTIRGLTGDALYNAAREAFCKKPTARKEAIKEAHSKISHSSN